MLDEKSMEQLQAEAHEKYKDDPETLAILLALELEISKQSRINGTKLTLDHMEPR